MTELDDRLAKLDELLSKLERKELLETVQSLERRVAELASKPAPSRDADAQSSAKLKAFLAGLLAAAVPLSTALYGWMEQERLRLETEHEIVVTHLTDALENDLADPYDLEHLRHLRFLRQLAPSRSAWRTDPDDLKGVLGRWAEQEYEQKQTQVESVAKQLAEDINRRRVHLAWLEMELRLDRGWFTQEHSHWVRNQQMPAEDHLAPIKELFVSQEAEIRDLTQKLAEQQTHWERLVMARERAKPEAQPADQPDRQRAKPELEYAPMAPIDYLERRCRQPRDQHEILDSVERLSACTLAARLHYMNALSHGPSHPMYGEWLDQANSGFEDACDDGWGEACHLLAHCYRLGHLGTPIRQADVGSLQMQLDLLERAAELGYAEAFNGLGWMYWEGEAVDRSEIEALRLFKLSCELNSLNGCDSLGTWYEREDADHEKAAEWYDYACGGGDVRGCVNRANLDVGRAPSDFGTPQPRKDTSSESKLAFSTEPSTGADQ